MRKICFYLLIIALIPMSVNAQDAKHPAATTKKSIEYASAFGLSYGIDNNINAYRLKSNEYGNTFSAGSSNFNISAGYGWMVSNKWRPRVEVRYTKLSYNVGWDNSNVQSINKSTINMYNCDIDLRADYMFVNSNKLQMYVSPAVKWEFSISRDERNFLNTPTSSGATANWGSYNNVIDENPRNLVGASLAGIVKYNIVKKIGFTLTPEYTMFFRNFVKANDKAYGRFSVNFGVEFNFL